MATRNRKSLKDVPATVVGARYGKLTAVERLEDEVITYDSGSKKTYRVWRCKCDCGNEIVAKEVLLRCGSISSCGCLSRRHKPIEIGDKFGELTVVSFGHKKITPGGKHNRNFWKCKCSCGNEIEVDAANLKSGNTKSCGCVNKVYPPVKPGNVYGKLTVIAEAAKRVKPSGKRRRWLCQCDCGGTIVVDDDKLKTQQIKSCGCLRQLHDPRRQDPNITRFMIKAAHISARTNCGTDASFYRYGGRGIKCELGDTLLDIADSLNKVPGYFEGATIDRIDNNGNYTLFHPEHGYGVWLYHDDYDGKDYKAMGNLRWISNEHQQSNRDFMRRDIKPEELALQLLPEQTFNTICNLNNFNKNDFKKIPTTLTRKTESPLFLYIHKSVEDKSSEYIERISKFFDDAGNTVTIGVEISNV